MFKSILFPTDGSEQANRALEYVIEIAGKFKSEVIILHTYNVPLTEYIPFNFDTKEINEGLLYECNKIILNAISRLKEAGINHKSYLKEGVAGSLIISTAELEGCDSVIMGSRGAGTVKSLLIGSVSNYVVHHAKFPVLLVY